VREALHEQQCVAHDNGVADELFDAHELVVFDKDVAFITEGDNSNDIFLILSGRAAICVKGREVAIREARQHVGEMAMIEPSNPRSATVVALEPVVAARISEPKFATIATKHPQLWRRLAMELADRLRERSKYVRPPNPRPVLFIGSSAEGLPTAQEIQSQLAHLKAHVYVWTNNIFVPGHYTMQDLETQVGSSDLGILVFTQDDEVINKDRKVDMSAPRDNVILELGMCIGALGHERSLIVRPRTRDLKIPSDLLGITPLEYDASDMVHLPAAIGPVCTAISKLVRELGPK
jgi:predicted nucleotide-binding protein